MKTPAAIIRYRLRHKDRLRERRKLAYVKEAAATRKRRENPRTWVAQQIPQLRYRAKLRGYTVDIDPAVIETPEFCPVFGTRLIYGAGVGNNNAASLDRFDNHYGYVTGNVRVVSWRANCLKKDATLEELRALVRYLEQPI